MSTCVRPYRSVILSALVCVLLPCPVIAQDQNHPGVEEIGLATRDAFRRDLQALRIYAFTRTVTRLSENRRGHLKDQEVLVMRIVPEAEGFHETLIEINGRTPTSDEVQKHREARTFERHYEQMIQGQVELPIVADLELEDLLESYHFSYVGHEVRNGKNVYRYSVDPAEEPRGASKTQRIAAASQGTIWVSRDSMSLVRLETKLARPLKTLGFGINELDMTLESSPVGANWLLSHIDVRAVYEVPLKVRRHNTWEYTDFEEVETP